MTFVEPPPGAPSRFGLLEAATVVTPDDPHALMGVEFQPVCGTAHLTVSACMDPDLDSQGEPVGKTVDDGIGQVEGVAFAVYHLFTCRPVGTDVAARAAASFEMAEPTAVEQWFGDYLTSHDDAVDLTPATGAVIPVDGLAALEAYAGVTYGGQPVIHGDRGLVSLLLATGQVAVSGGRLQTALGARVAAGGGYLETLLDPDGMSVTPDDEGWLYVTGPVGFWRGTVLNANTGIALNHEPVVAALNPGHTGGTATNVSSVLVERPYVGATSCLVGAIRVTRSACCPETEVLQ